MQVTVTGDTKKLSRQLRFLGEGPIRRATNRAVNKTARAVKVDFARTMRDETKLGIAFIKNRVLLYRSGIRTLTATLTVERDDLNIIEWVRANAKNTTAWRRKPGVKSKAWGKNKLYRGTFIGRGKNSGKLLVYRRDKTKRSGVAGVHGPSIRSYFASRRTRAHLNRFARKRFTKIFTSELAFELRKYRGEL